MGGTFDPIHNGHLTLAEYSRLHFGLEKVLFIPTGNPPHKYQKDIASSRYRYDMTLLAINSNPYFELSAMEIESQGITYTIDSIKKLQEQYKAADFYFVLGSDSFFNIEKWGKYKELIGLCEFIVVKRPDKDNKNLKDKVKQFNKKYNSKIHLLEAPLIGISSTDIRNRVKKGLSIKYLVPDSIEDYIIKKQMYKEKGNGYEKNMDS